MWVIGIVLFIVILVLLRRNHKEVQNAWDNYGEQSIDVRARVSGGSPHHFASRSISLRSDGVNALCRVVGTKKGPNGPLFSL